MWWSVYNTRGARRTRWFLNESRYHSDTSGATVAPSSATTNSPGRRLAADRRLLRSVKMREGGKPGQLSCQSLQNTQQIEVRSAVKTLFLNSKCPDTNFTTGVNALKITSTIFIALGNLQHHRPQLGRTRGVIKNLLGAHDRCWVSGDEERIRHGVGAKDIRLKDQTVRLAEFHFAECNKSLIATRRISGDNLALARRLPLIEESTPLRAAM